MDWWVWKCSNQTLIILHDIILYTAKKQALLYVLNTWDQSSRLDTRSVRFCCRTELRFHIHRWEHSPARTGSHCSLFEHIAQHQSIFTYHNQSAQFTGLTAVTPDSCLSWGADTPAAHRVTWCVIRTVTWPRAVQTERALLTFWGRKREFRQCCFSITDTIIVFVHILNEIWF